MFFNSSVIGQACLILMFFALRASYEYAIDVSTSNFFGSDAMQIISFGAVCVHEICLSIMLTSIKHPLVFVTLVLADVCENAFCLYSLYQTVHKAKKIVPMNDDNDDNHQGSSALMKRSSSVYIAIKNLQEQSNTKDRQGTALFIIAVLLQREMVETMIPLQALGIMSILYMCDVKANSVTSSWKSVDDYHNTLMYTGIDLLVEICVFGFTVAVLRGIFPDLSVWRILRGLINANFMMMVVFMLVCWVAVLSFQSAYGGMDTTFRFEWIRCKDKENATWLGGFDWEC